MTGQPSGWGPDFIKGAGPAGAGAGAGFPMSPRWTSYQRTMSLSPQ